MLYVKDGFPEVNEDVLCVVSKIYGNSVFVKLPEYEKEGVLTISEVAPGRIRNLRDHVVEEKNIICKILRVDEKQNRIDVSLRRVNLQARKRKQEQIKKEDFADRMYEEIAQKLEISKDDLFEKTYEEIFEEFDLVFEMLYAIMIDNSKIEVFSKLSKEEKEVFLQLVNDRIKPEEETLKRKFELTSIKEDGVIRVRSVIKNAVEKTNYDKINVIYLGAGDFEVKITHEDMKSADFIYKIFKQELENSSKSNFCEVKI
ncbi:MAG: S1 RNA-binding domain-containing protein [Nanoarchaeota archaeon]|nr:S1 RNA-binding domain-containing protein [Nanoarchaeota archaeon]